MPDPILREGRNCWRRAGAERVAFLVDGAAYFAAFRAAALRAERTITIVGWDIHSRMRLVAGEPADGLPAELGPFLNALLERNHRLCIRILVWDFAMIYAVEREVLPLLNREWTRHRRLVFRMDSTHPLGASHHQKIVVVDDKVAFCGGIDLTMRRWDTSEHIPLDPRRVDPDGVPYAPFHDVQAVVDGAAARALGELAGERWRRANGRTPSRPRTSGDPWPPRLAADLLDAEVAIARTVPAVRGARERREVQRLWEDAIASARRSIYIEQQYFTAANVAASIAARLAEPDGPDVVVVLPRAAHGWLEQAALADQQARTIRRLRAADRYGRLRFYYPVLPGEAPEEERWVRIHAKVLVVDDRLVRVGSSNTSNRSMGVDTECDLAVEATMARLRAGVAAFRDRLLGEHLGCAASTVAAAVASAGGLIAAIERLDGGARGFRRVDDELPEDPLRLHEEAAREANPFDPERPIRPDRFLDDFLPEAPKAPRLSRRIAASFAYVAILLGLIGLWVFTPLQQLVTADLVLANIETLRTSPLAPLAVALGFTVGGLALVPVTLLIAATAVAFGPALGFVYATVGVVCSGTAAFFIGRRAGRDLVRRLAGRRLGRISTRLARSGIVTVAVVRMLPIAPFTLVNMVAGAMHVRYRDFLLGTLVGMTPGLLAMTVLGLSIERILRGGGWGGAALLFAALAATGAVGWAVQRWIAPTRPLPVAGE
jgi:phosphatidylserine/phosphatidylglycerophosphate/cardiolipin synthase-like enzyme/uncharacterized membrane protein YdjX (TVP38/TMEM64 family)